MDEVRGGKMFWRQLNSRFGYGQIRILGSYEKRKLWGLRPHSPLKIKKDSNPALLFACRAQQGGKEKRKAWGLLAPKPLAGAPRPQTPSVGTSHTNHDIMRPARSADAVQHIYHHQ